MFDITGNQALTAWAVYALTNKNTNQIVFVWYCKAGNVANLVDALKNPDFNRDAVHTVHILGYYPDRIAAHNATALWMQKNGMPLLNRSQWTNRRNPVRCNETGQIFKNAAECAKAMGLNASQLSQHLRQVPGYRSIKGMTFSNTSSQPDAQAVLYPPQAGPYAIVPTPGA